MWTLDNVFLFSIQINEGRHQSCCISSWTRVVPLLLLLPFEWHLASSENWTGFSDRGLYKAFAMVSGIVDCSSALHLIPKENIFPFKPVLNIQQGSHSYEFSFIPFTCMAILLDRHIMYLKPEISAQRLPIGLQNFLKHHIFQSFNIG